MIKIQNFSKKYQSFFAVKKLNLSIEKGDIFGFIGPNGAGKTTTIRFLATLLQPSAGRALINGYDVTSQIMKVRHSIGYMPDNFGLYDGMKVWEFLDFFAVAYKMPRKRRLIVIEDVLALVDLTEKRNTLVNGLSRGMKQRLCLAKTLLHDPPVLILDEPASGLDPRARVEMKELLKELQRMGKTILISSHILSELAECCNKIGIMERGVLLAAGPIQEILKTVHEYRIIELTVLDQIGPIQEFLQKENHISNLQTLEANQISFTFSGEDTQLADLHRRLILQLFPILWFKERETSLEEVFLHITKGEVQ
ncbi:MAG: ABC transporter ATP-binding protein [Planctomycetota bacterium]